MHPEWTKNNDGNDEENNIPHQEEKLEYAMKETTHQQLLSELYRQVIYFKENMHNALWTDLH